MLLRDRYRRVSRGYALGSRMQVVIASFQAVPWCRVILHRSVYSKEVHRVCWGRASSVQAIFMDCFRSLRSETRESSNDLTLCIFFADESAL